VLTLFFIDSILAGFRAPVANPKSVNLTCPVESTKKFYHSVRHLVSPKNSTALLRAIPSHPTYLWFQISVNISELVKLAYAHEHLSGIEPGVFLLEHS
jgi:hypothetical protein